MAQRSGKQLGLYVPTETAEKLAALSERTMIPQSRLLRQALELLFEQYEQGAKDRARKPRK